MKEFKVLLNNEADIEPSHIHTLDYRIKFVQLQQFFLSIFGHQVT